MGHDRLQEFDTVYFRPNEFRSKTIQVQSCKHGDEVSIIKTLCFLKDPYLIQKYVQGSALQ